MTWIVADLVLKDSLMAGPFGASTRSEGFSQAGHFLRADRSSICSGSNLLFRMSIPPPFLQIVITMPVKIDVNIDGVWALNPCRGFDPAGPTARSGWGVGWQGYIILYIVILIPAELGFSASNIFACCAMSTWEFWTVNSAVNTDKLLVSISSFSMAQSSLFSNVVHRLRVLREDDSKPIPSVVKAHRAPLMWTKDEAQVSMPQNWTVTSPCDLNTVWIASQPYNVHTHTPILSFEKPGPLESPCPGIPGSSKPTDKKDHGRPHSEQINQDGLNWNCKTRASKPEK